jgi:hypothetical protein
LKKSNFLESGILFFIPIISIFSSFIFLVNENIGMLILAGFTVVFVALVFFLISLYLLLNFGLKPIIEIELNTIQLSFVQLGILLFAASSMKLIFFSF